MPARLASWVVSESVGGIVSDFARGDAQRRYLELLLRAGELLGESLEYQTTLQNVCAAVVEGIADICLLDLGTPPDTHLAAYAHRDTEQEWRLASAGRFLQSDEHVERHPVCSVVANGEPVLISRITDEYLRMHATSAEHEQFMRDMKYESMLIVPLMSSTQGTLGALTLVRTKDAEPYDQEDLRFALDLARRCATAIGKALLYQQTQRISTLFQTAALPAVLPAVPGIAFDAFYEPSSEELLVGGDWYDAFVLPDNRVAITVGDVLGHGVEAAVWMSRLRNSLRATLYTDPDPVRALVVADRLMRLESDEAFTTALVAIIDPVHHTMSCASAGHPGPIVFENDGTVTDRFIERTLPLGLRQLDPTLKAAQTITLHPGTFAAFFTDGLLEWKRDIASAWQAMVDAVARQDVRNSEHPAFMIRETVIGDAPHQDDIAILTVRVSS